MQFTNIKLSSMSMEKLTISIDWKAAGCICQNRWNIDLSGMFWLLCCGFY